MSKTTIKKEVAAAINSSIRWIVFNNDNTNPKTRFYVRPVIFLRDDTYKQDGTGKEIPRYKYYNCDRQEIMYCSDLRNVHQTKAAAVKLMKKEIMEYTETQRKQRLNKAITLCGTAITDIVATAKAKEKQQILTGMSKLLLKNI